MAEEDISRRADFAANLLSRLIATSKHEDEKIGRMFTAISFVALGAATVFVGFVSNKLLCPLWGVDLVPLFYLGHMVLLAVAIGFMFQAMSPRFHLRRQPPEEKPEGVMPGLAGYFKRVNLSTEEEWVSFLRGASLSALYLGELDDAARESHRVAMKIRRKIEDLKRAKRVLVLDVSFIVIMVALGISSLV